MRECGSALEWQSLTLTWEYSNPSVHKERVKHAVVSTAQADRMSHQPGVYISSAPHVWILSWWLRFPENLGLFKQTTTGSKSQLLNLPQRLGQRAEKWEWGLEFNYSLKALRVQYEREGWDINLQGCLCLYGDYNKKIIPKATAEARKVCGMALGSLMDEQLLSERHGIHSFITASFD